jgi:AraC-like DNA-binding protein
MARPKINIDWSTVEKLCLIQCTGEEIASVLGCSYDTLERRCKEEYEESFAEYIKRESSGGKASLRRAQWKKAIDDGNATMQIWLGKQYLGQRDKQEEVITHKVEEISEEWL